MGRENEPHCRASNAQDREEAASRWPGKESLATLLLRFLGVYVTARAAIWGVRTFAHLIFGLQHLAPNEAIRMNRVELLEFAAELTVGLYLLYGGRFVLEKLLMPVARNPIADVESPDEDGGSDTA